MAFCLGRIEGLKVAAQAVTKLMTDYEPEGDVLAFVTALRDGIALSANIAELELNSE